MYRRIGTTLVAVLFQSVMAFAGKIVVSGNITVNTTLATTTPISYKVLFTSKPVPR